MFTPSTFTSRLMAETMPLVKVLSSSVPRGLPMAYTGSPTKRSSLTPNSAAGRSHASMPDGTVGVVLVDDVTPGGSGDRAGILPEDYIVSFAGEPL